MLAAGHSVEDLEHVPAEEGPLAAGELVEDAAQGEDVGALVHTLGVADLLGGHVAGGAHGHARARALQVALFEQGLGEAEVGHLGLPAVHTLAEHDVGWLEVAVYDAELVSALHSVEDSQEQALGLVELHPLAQQPGIQCRALDKLHEQARRALYVEYVRDGDHVGVA